MGKKSFLSPRAAVIAVAALLMFFFELLPLPAGMTPDGARVLGVFCGALLLWLFVGIDWTSLFVILALSFVPALTMGRILQSSFGNVTFAFLLFSFICTGALTQTTLIRRIAVAFVSNKFARRGPWPFTFLFFAAVLFIGCFISPSVLFIVMLPILEEIFGLFGLKKGDPFAKILLIGLVCCCGIASGMTPIGHVYGPLAMGAYAAATGKAIDYFAYMAFAVPVGLLTTLLMFLVFRFVARPDTSAVASLDLESMRLPGEVTRREKLILLIFALVVVLWILPSFIKNVFPAVAKAISAKSIAFPPLVGVILMSVVTVDGAPLLPFNKVMKENIAWGALIMCAGTLALGAAMTAKGVELNTYLSALMSPVTRALSPMALVVLFTLWAAVQTNLSSNIVTITVVTSIAIPVLMSMNGAVSTPAVVSIIGMMGGYAFAAPPAMPSVAISIGTGWVDAGTILKYGTVVMLLAVAITVLVGYPIAVSFMGF